jgi:hypothetical protein
MKTYGQPLFYSIASAVGLVIALLSESWGDAIGLALLLTPLWPLVRATLVLRRAR